MILENVVLNTNGAGLFPEGDAAKLIVRKLFGERLVIREWGTNASENHTLSIELEKLYLHRCGRRSIHEYTGQYDSKELYGYRQYPGHGGARRNGKGL